MGSGLAVGRTLKCERTGFWVGLQIAPLRAGGVRYAPFRVLCVPFSPNFACGQFYRAVVGSSVFANMRPTQ